MFLRVSRSRIAARTAGSMPGKTHRLLYVVEGDVRVNAGRQCSSLGPDSAWFGADAVELLGGANGATLLAWELSETAAPPAPEDASTVLLLEQPIAINGPRAHLIRLDRVSFPPGGIAYTHTHQGPGIRVLLDGEITIEVNGGRHPVAPGHAWFEAGPDPVLALASEREPTSFARVMVLPVGLIGKSSISYVKPEDIDKPKLQSYKIYIDTALEL